MQIPQYQEERYQYAEEKNSLKSLIAYPYLLWRWQVRHPEDIMRVATIASHRLFRHRWCGEKCETIDAFLRRQLLQNVCTALRKRQKELGQELLF